MSVSPSLLLGMDGVPVLVELSSAFGEPTAHIESFLCHSDEQGGSSFGVLSPSHCFSQDSCLSAVVAVGRAGLEREENKVILAPVNRKRTGLWVYYLLAFADVKALGTVLLGGGFFRFQESDKEATANWEGRRLVLFIVVECGHVACFAEWLPSDELMQQL